jgi:hypothetical protein
VIKRTLVRGLAPPEHGGVLNLPDELQKSSSAGDSVKELISRVREGRKALGLPNLEAFWVDRFAKPTSISLT